MGSSTLNFLTGQLRYFNSNGWEVHAVCSPDHEFDRALSREGVLGHSIPMEREISPAKDLIALMRWIRVLRTLRPAIVNVGTPKASLLGLLAARIARVPFRVYTVRGLRYQTETGAKRRLLLAVERLTIANSHLAVAVSPSVRAEMESDGLNRRPIAVIGDGSSNGVDQVPANFSSPVSRESLGISESAFVVGFVGRLHPSKGASELAEAIDRISGDIDGITLMVVGESESREMSLRLKQLSATVVETGWVENTRDYYSLLDVLCLPTFREGFPNVILEASAHGVPTITTTATGAVDSVLHGETGLLVPAGDAGALSDALLQLGHDFQRRKEMGRKAREWVIENFPRERIWEGLASIYRRSPSPDVSITKAYGSSPLAAPPGRYSPDTDLNDSPNEEGQATA
ncbi:glycosyltransferase family 4 protein [Janibacter sp. YIM B02568]|uniref:glycosyltransferase family 4 protein n=1 Tax=Janibacter endophyticus TaxID=2806261 RepID=UPI00194E8CB7|nr:glycosyltransferase family 4 protein [Janibacter endophyticus]MBM6545757.1 glycosyltransferase family 4 protein [Janibacter endophyticus]